eukprot:TRINITY_DN5639_c0_g1_i1.p1 TRINITY_DN5639_c0_g1~~TRINITY_DN5639_c0_g1_i1.p1  ORF type:complete len:502 (+),score=127.88 TRINITY_DN5639_c0_g1_i1:55-1506(+)
MVSAATKLRRRKEGIKRKKKQRVEVSLIKDPKEEEENIEIVTVGIDKGDAGYDTYKKVFEKLQITDANEQKSDHESESEDPFDDVDIKDEKPSEVKGPSKKAKRAASRLTIAQLKQCVSNPRVVELHDKNAADPKLLIHLKSYRNTVPIPGHWCQKRRYLSVKRGHTKPPFELPPFIAATGIARIREQFLKREESRRDRLKSRDKSHVKIDKIDIDFHVLHDAFHIHQTKPPMSTYGEVYYEGREKEIRNRAAKPGHLSDRLKEALGIPEGYPPPWLINMQKFGPPPSYPSLKIPGLTAPLPKGASFGYHAGGWGKIPTDRETGQPLFGHLENDDDGDVRKQFWGAMKEDRFESDDEEDDVADNREPSQDREEAISTPPPPPPPERPTVKVVDEAPDLVDLRKHTPVAGGPAGTIIEQVSTTSKGFLGPTFGYRLGGNIEETTTTTDEKRPATDEPADVKRSKKDITAPPPRKETKRKKEFKF